MTAAIAAVGAAGTTLVTFMGLAVIGWFLADAGAHGQTTDALRVGADVWLVGHGAQLTASGVPLGIVPLTVTAVLAVVLSASAAGPAPPPSRWRTTARWRWRPRSSPASTS